MGIRAINKDRFACSKILIGFGWIIRDILWGKELKTSPYPDLWGIILEETKCSSDRPGLFETGAVVIGSIPSMFLSNYCDNNKVFCRRDIAEIML